MVLLLSWNKLLCFILLLCHFLIIPNNGFDLDVDGVCRLECSHSKVVSIEINDVRHLCYTNNTYIMYTYPWTNVDLKLANIVSTLVSIYPG